MTMPAIQTPPGDVRDATVIRPATTADLDHILAAFERLREGSGLDRLAPEEVERLVACNARSYAAVATIENEVVGYGRWVRRTPSAPRADMAVAVAERWEHQGIGTAMLTHLRREARKRGVQHLEIRLARTPELEHDLEHGSLWAKVRDEGPDVLIGLRTADVLPGQEHDAMRWAARGFAQIVGPVMGDEPPPK